MRYLRTSLSPGTDLYLHLEAISRKEPASGFILGIIGNLSNAAFQCPEKKSATLLEGPLEILNMNGTISPIGVHLHLCISDKDCRVWGGHLEKGSIVLKGVDILIGLLEEGESKDFSQKLVRQEQLGEVEIAVIPNCPWSKRAMKMLRTLSIPYKVDLIDNDNSFNRIKSKSGLSSFPQIFINGRLIGGYSELAEMHASGEIEALRQ